MRDFLNDFGFHIQLVLVGICWAFMGIYGYEFWMTVKLEIEKL